MFVQNLVEETAANVISQSFASGSVNGWNIYQGLGTEFIQFPCVKVICWTFEPAYKELNVGVGKAVLEVLTCALKTETSASVFESVSDLAINPFLDRNIENTMASGSNLKILLVSDAGLEVTTLEDGWTASQKFEVVCSRTS